MEAEEISAENILSQGITCEGNITWDQASYRGESTSTSSYTYAPKIENSQLIIRIPRLEMLEQSHVFSTLMEKLPRRSELTAQEKILFSRLLSGAPSAPNDVKSTPPVNIDVEPLLRNTGVIIEIGDSLELLTPLKTDFKNRIKEPFLANALNYYVWPDVVLSRDSTERFPLRNRLLQSKEAKGGFLVDQQPLLLLQGDSGAGKSLGLHYLARCIWLAREKPDDECLKDLTEDIKWLKTYVPLLIDLKSLDNQAKGNLIPWFLGKQGYTAKQIQMLKVYYRFLILLDGYDELSSEAKDRNIYADNQLGGWNAKVVITCRTEYLTQVPDYRLKFSSSFGHNVSDLQEMWLAPFSAHQIDEYIDHYEKGNVGLQAQQKTSTKDTFTQFSGLKELVTSPLLLQMVIKALPEIKEQLTKSQQHVTRALIYEAFICQWFEREKGRLQDIDKNGQFKKLTPQSFRNFAQAIAFKMFEKDVVEVLYEPSMVESDCFYDEPKDQEWDKFFGNEDEEIVQKRMACPLRFVSNRYSFYHKSFLEYFVASHLYYYNLALGKKEEIFKKVLADLENNALNKKRLTSEPAIISFLVEIVQENLEDVSSEVKKERLFQIVTASRNNEKVAKAAANAATVLAAGNVSFSGRDLSQINIKGADLSNAIFSYVSLKGANLQNVNLSSAHLEHTDLTGADLTGVQLGEWPSFEYQHRVHCVNYSQNGCYMAVGEGNDVVLYRRQKNGLLTVQTTFVGDSKEDILGITSLAFHPDTQILASSSHGDNIIYLWDLKNLQLLKRLKEHEVILGDSNGVNSVAFSPNGRILASGGYDQTVHLWNTQTYEEMATFSLPNNSNHIYRVAFNWNGKILAFNTSSDMHLWNLQTQEKTILEKQCVIDSFVFSPQDDLLAIGNRSVVNLWNATNHQKIFSFSIEHESDHRGQLTDAVAFDSLGEILAAGTGNNAVYLWNVNTRQLLGIFKGHTNEVQCIAFDPVSRILASGSLDKSVRFWNIERLQVKPVLNVHKGEIENLLFNPIGRMLVSTSQDKTIRIWDVETRQALASLEVRSENEGVISNKPLITFTATGEIMVILSLYRVSVWNPHTFAYQLLLEATENKENYGGVVLENAAIEPKSKILAEVRYNKIILWNVESQRKLATLEGHDGEVDEIPFNLPNELLALGDVATLLTTLKELGNKITDVAFNTTGELLASAHRNGHIHLWHIKTRQLLILDGHESIVCKVAFEPSNQLLASSSQDGTVRLWSLRSYQTVATFTGFSYLLDRVVFNSDGQILAVADDSNIHLYHVRTYQKLTCLRGHTSRVKSLTFSPNDLLLASGSADGAIFIWAKCTDASSSTEKWRLVWRCANSFPLSAENVFLKEAKISETNLKLLKQRGANDDQVPASNSCSWNRSFLTPNPVVPSIFAVPEKKFHLELLDFIGKELLSSKSLTKDISITREEIAYSIEDSDNFYTADMVNLLLYQLTIQNQSIKVLHAIYFVKLEAFHESIQSQDSDYIFTPLNVFYDKKSSKYENHWAALIIDKKHQLIFYFDPAQKKAPTEITSLKDLLGYKKPIILNPIDFQQNEKKEGFIRHCGPYMVEIFKAFVKCIGNGQIISDSYSPDIKIAGSISAQTALSTIPCGAAENILQIRQGYIKEAYLILKSLSANKALQEDKKEFPADVKKETTLTDISKNSSLSFWSSPSTDTPKENKNPSTQSTTPLLSKLEDTQLIDELSHAAYCFNFVRGNGNTLTIECTHSKHSSKQQTRNLDKLQERLKLFLKEHSLTDSIDLNEDENNPILKVESKDSTAIDIILDWLVQITDKLKDRPLQGQKTNYPTFFAWPSEDTKSDTEKNMMAIECRLQ